MLNSKLFIGPHIAPEMIIIVQIPTVLPAIHIMNWYEKRNETNRAHGECRAENGQQSRDCGGEWSSPRRARSGARAERA